MNAKDVQEWHELKARMFADRGFYRLQQKHEDNAQAIADLIGAVIAAQVHVQCR
jgi:hypothetical protein